VVATLYLLSLVLITKSIYKAVLFAFIPLGLINIGQIYITTVIPINAVRNVVNFQGRQLYFHFSPFFVLQLTSIFLFLAEIAKRKGKVKLSLAHVFLFISFFFSTISVFNSEQFPSYSFTIMIGTIGSISWLTLVQLHLRESTKTEKNILLKTFLLIIILMSSVQISVGLGQYIRKSTLNLRIEQTTVIPNFGQGADEDGTQFRPVGLQTHANSLANSQIIFLFSALVLFQYLREKNVHFPWGFEVLIVGTMIILIFLTQSRAAYLSLGLGGGLFLLSQQLLSQKQILKLRSAFQSKIFVFILLAFFFVPMISNRLLYSLNSFGAGGGFTTRQELEKLSLLLIQKHTLWGVGPAMFIPAAFKESPTGIIQYFPESVHQGFLLFVSEHGVLSFSFLMAFYVALFKDIERRLSPLMRTNVYAGIVATCCMMFFHPFQNFLTTFILIIWLVVYIQDNKKNNEKP